MLLATIFLLFAVPQTADASKAAAANEQPVASADATDSASDQLPAGPTAKVKSDLADGADASGSLMASASAPAEPAARPTPSAFEPAVKPAYTRPRETPGQRKMWYALTVTSHAAAAFDAWSTRRAVVMGYSEANPMLRPFASSNAIYVATQVSPAVMDYLGKRMMVSQHKWIRRMWWVPQVAGSGFSIGAGAHNIGITQ